MVHIPELNYGGAGYPALDSTGRSPLEKSAYDPSSPAVGVPCDAFKSFRIKPLTMQANNVFALATPTASGALTLTAGTGVTNTTITINNVLLSVLDITGGQFSRSLRIVGQNGVTQRSYTIAGYDEYNQLTTQTLNGPSGNQIIETTKCWRYISGITITGGTSSAITIGTGDTYGMPVAVYSWDYFLDFLWNNANIATATGFTAADTTSPATPTTGHVRGTYTIQSHPSDGATTLQAFILMSAVNAANMNLAYGVIPA